MILDPPQVFLFFIALSCAYANQIENADITIDKLIESPIQDIMSQLGIFLKIALQGEKSKIHQLLSNELLNTAKRDFQVASIFTAFYAKLDEKEEALDWLEHTVNRGFINYPFLNEYDPFLENIRGEERFKKLMKRVNHEWENFSA